MGDLNQKFVDNQDPETLPWFAEYLAVDRGNPPAFLTERSTKDLGNTRFSKERYISREWHDQEMEKVWKRVWQMACTENDIPEVGDQIEYTIGDQSIMIVRSGPDEIRAFHNACRHRGTPLIRHEAVGKEIRCPFHGWSYNLDGSLKTVPCRWDFPEVTDDEYSLVSVKLARWCGFVFINLDPNAMPFEDFLPQEVRSHLEYWWKSPRRYKALHVRHEVPCNWKLGLEAFTETYHVPVLHPETLYSVGDYNTQYDFYGPHCRMVFTQATPSPALGGGIDPQAVIDEMFVGEGAIGEGFAQALGDKYDLPEAEPGDTLVSVRQKIADMMRDVYAVRTGRDFSEISDSEALDGYEYLLFPNFHIWGGYIYPACYRWLPAGNDPEKCTYEVMLFMEAPPGEPLPKDAQVVDTVPGSQLADAPGTKGPLGFILDEDVDNLRRIQLGQHSDSFTHATYANSQERNIRNFHNHLDGLLDKP